METTTPETTTTETTPEPKPAAQGASFDQSPEPPKSDTQPEDDKDVLDILQPKAAPKTWRLGPEGLEREYVQRPLSFISKMQWFSLVGEVLDKAMSGPSAMSMNNLLSAPGGREGDLTMDDFRDADTFVQAVGKLLVYAPDFLEKSFCIWLGVPDYERETARQMMAEPPENGGLSDDDGLEIIEIFIDQNYEALDSFFREKVGALRKRVEIHQKRASDSRSSRR